MNETTLSLTPVKTGDSVTLIRVTAVTLPASVTYRELLTSTHSIGGVTVCEFHGITRVGGTILDAARLMRDDLRSWGVRVEEGQ